MLEVKGKAPWEALSNATVVLSVSSQSSDGTRARENHFRRPHRLMAGFLYVGASEDASAGGEALDLLTISLMAPARYKGSNDFARHLDAAMASVALDMELLDHVNMATGQRFECTAYYADDSETQAWCARHGSAHFSVLGITFARRLAAICQRIADAVLPLNLSAEPREDLLHDPELATLLRDDASVSDNQLHAIVLRWPDPGSLAMQRPLDGCALFYDMLRLVWMHELAHALCGHVAFVQERLGMQQLHEFAAERLEDAKASSGPPRHELLQTLEVHADDFAARYCVGQMLAGSDPVNEMMGPRIDLGQRQVVFNLACCIFTIMWSEAERRYLPDVSFRAGISPTGKPHIHTVTPTSHPPAALRYMRFRGTQQSLCEEFSKRRPESAAQTLSLLVDAASFGLVVELAQLDPAFERLLVTTPLLARTPDMKILEAYEDELMELSAMLAPVLARNGYVPWLQQVEK